MEEKVWKNILNHYLKGKAQKPEQKERQKEKQKERQKVKAAWRG